MYYEETREKALNNGCNYHLAAFLKRRKKLVKIGVNSMKTHPRYFRVYPDGNKSAHMHAEMNVLRFARPGDVLEVVRYQKSTTKFTMAKPCRYCMNHIRKAGIRRVRYTNWNGDWEEFNFEKSSYKNRESAVELIKIEDA